MGGGNADDDAPAVCCSMGDWFCFKLMLRDEKNLGFAEGLEWGLDWWGTVGGGAERLEGRGSGGEGM